MKTKGFTLIELMIVVAIVAIIAAIALPAFKQHRDRQAGVGQFAPAPLPPTSTLVCVNADGHETRRDPAVPGLAWRFEGGVFVAGEGSNVKVVSPNGQDCEIKTG